MKVPHLQHTHIYTALNGSVLDSRMHVHVYRCSAMPDSLRCHGLQPARPLCPWDFPGKSTGVGCHFLLQCMKVKSESEVAQLGPTLRDPMDCSLPGSSIYSHAKEWNWTLAFYQSQKLTCNGWIKGLSIRAETVKLLVGNKKNAH